MRDEKLTMITLITKIEALGQEPIMKIEVSANRNGSTELEQIAAHFGMRKIEEMAKEWHGSSMFEIKTQPVDF